MDNEKEIKRLGAEVRRWKGIANSFEKETEVVDRIVRAVNNSIEALEPIPVPQIYVPEGAEHDETVLLLISDTHIGKKTRSYDHKVFAKRLKNLEKRVLSIVSAHRSIRPLTNLVIVFAGDICDAEAVFPSQAVDHISIPVLDQIFTAGLPAFTSFIYEMLANFETVKCICVRGNHGRQNQAKWSSSKSTNWDFVFYRAIEAATRGQERLEWVIDNRDWKALFRIEGWGFLACHGDMIRRYYSLPFYGMTRQAQRWQAAYRERIKLTYFLMGHFHSAVSIRFNQAVIQGNGSFTTDDPFAEEVMGVTSVPEQLLMGVHPSYGISWIYRINVK